MMACNEEDGVLVVGVVIAWAKNDGSDDEEYTQYLRNGDMTRWMS